MVGLSICHHNFSKKGLKLHFHAPMGALVLPLPGSVAIPIYCHAVCFNPDIGAALLSYTIEHQKFYFDI